MFQKKKDKLFVTDDRLDSVAVIMDGNGRWAKRRMLPRTAGHVAGAKNVVSVLETFRKIGVHHVTLYAFSTENWKRPQEEVDALMNLIYQYLDTVVIPRIRDDGQFSVVFLGDKSPLPEKLREKCIEVEEMAKGRPFICNVALNYGGRDEILHAANRAVADGHKEITADVLSSYMYTSGSPDPDLLIRTGGDLRISNFLLWQCAYSELYFTPTLWPDFDEGEIMKAVNDFYGRKRRFGGLDKEEEQTE
ncbi:MAG: polyprenyl diphosphate synthase [Clostridia bacterium]|nr:polyprenyl diphosphate synthase [Clostridia bacterium]